MKVIRGRGVTVYVSNDVYDWPGNRKEILDKMDELEAIIESFETGRTQRLT